MGSVQRLGLLVYQKFQITPRVFWHDSNLVLYTQYIYSVQIVVYLCVKLCLNLHLPANSLLLLHPQEHNTAVEVDCFPSGLTSFPLVNIGLWFHSEGGIVNARDVQDSPVLDHACGSLGLFTDNSYSEDII